MDFSLNADDLSTITDARTFNRGREYARLGLVGAILEHNGTIEAAVHGTRHYQTKLWREKDVLHSSCTCPLGEDGIFCKHCVALGLSWLGEGPDESTGEDESSSIDLDEIREHLLTRDKSDLADIILSQAVYDERLLRRLTIDTAKVKRHGNKAAVLRGVIDAAIRQDGFISYHEAGSYARGIEDAANGIQELLESGEHATVIELAEYALKAVEHQMDSIDDSDGNMRPILDRLQEIHHEACVKEKPDAKALARRLFTWELESDWEVFYGAASTYKDALGTEGMAIYRALAEAAWSNVKPLSPGRNDAEKYGKRFRITHIMETLALQTGDVEQLVAVKARDLSSAYNFLQIAEEYKKAGLDERALEWAERGVRAFPRITDSRLREFLANEYHRLKRHEDAMALIWQEFIERPGLDECKLLKSHADKSKTWPQWREKAFTHLRTVLEKEKTATKKDRLSWGYRPDNSTIVRILLWEKNPEAAWDEAQKDGCSEGLWRELAQLREKGHPMDAIPIYQRSVETELNRKNTDGYHEAVRTLKIIQRLMKAAGEETRFPAYIESVRAEHRAKRNFMKLLDHARWE
jgi:hypothetical protein